MLDPNTLWPNVIEGSLIAAPLGLGVWWLGRCLVKAARIIAGKRQ